MTTPHRNFTDIHVHTPITFTFADSTAREAGTGYTLAPADVSKFAFQSDDLSIWILTDDSPITWQAVAGQLVSDDAYDEATWNGDTTHAPSKNAIRDKIETMGGGTLPTGLFSPITPPPTTGWSWVNQGSATLTSGGGSEIIFAPVNGTSNLRVRVRSTPSTPYTVTALVTVNIHSPANYPSAGLCIRQISDGKMIVFSLSNVSTIPEFLIQEYSGPVAGFVSTLINEQLYERRVWLQIEDNGTTRFFRYSFDGINFIEVYSHARTTYVTADQIGFYADSNNATYPASIALHSWVET